MCKDGGYGKAVEDYIMRADWRVHENANGTYNNSGLVQTVAGKAIAEWWLERYSKIPGVELPTPEVSIPFDKTDLIVDIDKGHREAWFHIHDLGKLAPYCAGWSLKDLIYEGFGGPTGYAESSPAKHFDAILGQMVNFLGVLQQEWAGAQAFNSFDTLLAPFVKIDGLDYKAVKQGIQEFVYALNVPSRWGESPFTNITLDLVCPDDLKDEWAVVGGRVQSFKYGDCQREMDMINKAYLEVMLEGDAKGRVFTFPIPTYNVTEDWTWEGEIADLLFEVTAKYGLPYFQNFINSDLDPGMIRSMCCRLQLDLTELEKRGGGLFGSADMTGSIGVVTINMAKLGYLYRDKEYKLFKALDKLVDLAIDSLEMKRDIVADFLERGLYPYTSRYLKPGFRNHFSTVGVLGINEMILNFTGGHEDISTEYGQELAHKVLDFVREKIQMAQKETGHLYNLEATPAEGATYRMAKKDRELFGDDIIQAGTPEAPYYTNSSQLPVGFTEDIFEALDLQEELQRKYTGGTVFHAYIGEPLSKETTRKLVKRILENYRIPYLTITPTFSICPIHGYLPGEHHVCPKCKPVKEQKCEVWTRVMGYFRPVSQYNPGKKSEFKERRYFDHMNNDSRTDNNYKLSFDHSKESVLSNEIA